MQNVIRSNYKEQTQKVNNKFNTKNKTLKTRITLLNVLHNKIKSTDMLN